MHVNPPPTWLPGQPYRKVNPSAKSAPMETPIYGDVELGGFLHDCLSVGGTVTFNVGDYQEGYLGEETVQQLGRIT